tara:strand:- start:102 stop:509 length:408 start_codon:yes stop_codon:yes gene_type:complete
MKSRSGSVSTIQCAPSLRFAVVAKLLTNATASEGLLAPSFKSPPVVNDVDRAVRMSEAGSVVSVRLKDRPFEAVVADMVEGVVVCNQLSPTAASQLRNLLWSVVLHHEGDVDNIELKRSTVLVHQLPNKRSNEAA